MFKGIYDLLINNDVRDRLQNLSDNFLVEKGKMDDEEINEYLSFYLFNVFKVCLDQKFKDVKKENFVDKKIELVNSVVSLLKDFSGQVNLEDFFLDFSKDVLEGIKEKSLSNKNLIRPVTSISNSSLFTGACNEPELFTEIRKEILSCNKIYMLISFIKWSGLRILLDVLQEFTDNGGVLKVITTSYMGASDYKAIVELSKLKNTEIKISYDTERTRLHAKSYIFFRDTGFTTAYIGSSNMSKVAMSSGLEWNLKVSRIESAHIIDKFIGTFETYWLDSEFYLFDGENEECKQKLRQSLNLAKKDDRNNLTFFDIKPHGYQQEILDKLIVEREIHGNFRNLIVAATGTGKTVISAFDYFQYVKSNPDKKNSLLFIAHREEILKQSLDTFRIVLRDYNFGDILSGNHLPNQLEFIFCTIQSSQKLIDVKPVDFYDFIVIDEFHHGAAKTYVNLLSYFNPKVLVGLTATPERMDGDDFHINEFFNGKYSAEIRLPEAIDRKLLAPFQYFGVTDSVDYSNLTWTKGSYVKSELENVYTGDSIRANLIKKAVFNYLESVEKARGLGFCVTKKHAEFMADFFNKNKIPSIALTSDSPIELRNSAKQMLIKKEINFIFTVDLYNEGVDIKEVDTILLLRPTESLTVFIQQIGRGLRNNVDEKDCCTILDFIGQANKNYNFEQRFRALIGKTSNSVEKELEYDFPHMPAGSFIKLERKSKEYVLNNLKQYFNNRYKKSNIIEKLKTFKNDTGKECILDNFLNYYNLPISYIYDKKLAFSDYKIQAGIMAESENKNPEIMVKALARIQHIDSVTFIRFLKDILSNIDKIKYENMTKNEQILFLMFYANFNIEINTETEIEIVNNFIEILRQNRQYIEDLKEIIEYKYQKIDLIEQQSDLKYEIPLDIHASYTRDEILSALEYYTFSKKPSQREGVLYIENKKTDIFFITLNKTEKMYSTTTMYKDYALNENLFHWESQSTTTTKSKTGQRYINKPTNKTTTLLFVRENKTQNVMGAPYHYLGQAEYVSHQGEKPISIIWKLKHKIPAKLLKISKQLVTS